jgi:hypothetical protein
MYDCVHRKNAAIARPLRHPILTILFTHAFRPSNVRDVENRSLNFAV